MDPLYPWSHYYTRLMRALAQHQGKILNCCDLARAANIPRQRVRVTIEDLHSRKLIRLLPPLQSPTAPDTMRTDKVYLRPQAWAVAFTPDQLTESDDCDLPLQSLLAAGASEQIIAAELRRHPNSRFSTMNRYHGRSLDLVIERGSHRLGFVFEPNAYDQDARKAHRAVLAALEAGWIHRGYVVTLNGLPQAWPGPYLCLSATELLKDYQFYTRLCPIEELMRKIPWQHKLPWVTQAAPDPESDPQSFQLFRDIRPP